MIKNNYFRFLCLLGVVLATALFSKADIATFKNDTLVTSLTTLATGHLKELLPGYFGEKQEFIYLEFAELTESTGTYPNVLSVVLTKIHLSFDGNDLFPVRLFPLTDTNSYSYYLGPKKNRFAIWSAIFPISSGTPKLKTSWLVSKPTREILQIDLSYDGSHEIIWLDETVKNDLTVELFDSDENKPTRFFQLCEKGLSYATRNDVKYRNLNFQYLAHPDDESYTSIPVDDSGFVELPLPPENETYSFFVLTTEALLSFDLENNLSQPEL